MTETKSNLTADMEKALIELLRVKDVAIISGGSYKQVRKQFITKFHCPPALLSRLHMFPTTATSFYRYKSGWKKVYRHILSKKQRNAIRRAFQDVLREINYVPPKKLYGKVIEDRETQVTFSALGQEVVSMLGKEGVRLKKKWTKENTPL